MAEQNDKPSIGAEIAGELAEEIHRLNSHDVQYLLCQCAAELMSRGAGQGGGLLGKSEAKQAGVVVCFAAGAVAPLLSAQYMKLREAVVEVLAKEGQ